MQTAVIYARFSPRPNSADCDSVEKQIADLKRWCEAQNLIWQPDLVFFDKAASGADWERPGLWDALLAVKKGRVLVARSIDRVARSVYLLGAVKHMVERAGGKLATMETGGHEPGDEAMVNLMQQLLGAFAEYQRHVIGARIRAGVKRRMEAGIWNYASLPYGYRRKPGTEDRLEPVEEEQAQLLIIKGLLDDKYSMSKIADYMNASGYSWKDGTPWTKDRVRVVIRRWKHNDSGARRSAKIIAGQPPRLGPKPMKRKRKDSAQTLDDSAQAG